MALPAPEPNAVISKEELSAGLLQPVVASDADDSLETAETAYRGGGYNRGGHNYGHHHGGGGYHHGHHGHYHGK